MNCQKARPRRRYKTRELYVNFHVDGRRLLAVSTKHGIDFNSPKKIESVAIHLVVVVQKKIRSVVEWCGERRKRRELWTREYACGTESGSS